MDPFSATVLAQLTADLTGGVVSSLSGALKRQLSGTPEQQALERSIRAGIVALVAQTTAATATPEEEDLLADIFEKFFHHPVVWVAISQLIGGTPLDHAQLRGLFTDPDDPDTGYDLERLQSVDFDAALDAFTAAFVESVRGQKELAHIVQSGLLGQLVRGQGESTQQIRELVARIDQLATVAVRAGNVVDGASGKTVYQWQYVGRDKIDNAGNVLSGDFRGATIHIVNQYMKADGAPALSEERFRTALRKYLEWVDNHYGQLHLRGIERREQHTLTLRLDEVYLSLAATISPDKEERRDNQRKPKRGSDLFLKELSNRANPPSSPAPLPVAKANEESVDDDSDLRTVDMAELLALGNHLVIIGGPGSGKTTFLHLVASAVAHALLSGDSTGMEAKLGLTGPLPLPVYVSLGEYNRYRRKAEDMDDPAKGTLTAFVSYALIRQHAILGVPPDFFERLLLNGQSCLLLLDGLDEIANEDERGLVRQDIQNLADNPDSGRILVTSRTRAYQGRAILPETFRHALVQPMSPEQVNLLVEHWCQAVYDDLERPIETQRLQKEIVDLEAHRAVRGEERLADTPLMVTIIAIVHYNDRHLPEQRAALYDRCIDVLLAEPYKPETEAAVEFSKWGGTTADKRYFLSHLAFEMMSAGSKAGRVIEEHQLREWMAPLFVRRMGGERAAKELDDFCKAMKERGSLLDERDCTYQFVHLTFQEFLCATFLAENRREVGKIVAFFIEDGRLTESWWRETILLTVGYLGLRPTDASLELARQLAQLPGDNETALAGAELAGRAFLELEAQEEATNKDLAARLETLLTNTTLMAPNPLRAAAGVALGRLGDPRKDVNCEIPATVLIPAGPFRMGSDKQGRKSPWYDEMAYDDEEPNHEIAWLDFDYRIGKYPVTVAQYRHFVEAGGYDPRKSAQYWQGGGLKWLRESGQKAPRYWDDPQWTVDNHPVVGVTWYEAVAYCNWLNAIKPAGCGVFRLPDEAMWEKAARGTDGRRWPWGNEWDATKLNSREGGINCTSAVGIFPAGRRRINEGRKSEAAEFIYDCAGNVWEWCSGPGVGDAPYPFKRRSYKEDLGLASTFRALRGGSWNDLDLVTRAAYRGNYVPVNGDVDVGFRVVELLSDSEF